MGPPMTTGSIPDLRAGGGTYFLGRYRVVDEIGIGGMASVHLARMDGPGGFQKWVAVKKIHPHLVEDESFVQMFLDEARVAARISHPNVATVFDLGKHEDTYWIAMEYLHGEPLREVMRRTEELGTAMPPEIACRVIADAAEGLHAAHELLGKNGEKLGLVHRDVTPHNLFVTYDGVTKVVDFGIAKFSSRMSHTRAGTLKGKLAYMSPEQVHGEGIDRRTDIFALGVVLWELTTGQRLFRMESDLDTLAKVQECNVPRPSTLIRGYPVDLEKIVMKALAKNRGERFRTAREFSRALQSLLMRRGLFIASDEVAAYTQSIFQDRIQKREAHLRWAAEVTQTINLEQMLAKPKIGPEYTNSEIQAAQLQKPPLAQNQPPGGPVRPAAGMPMLQQTGPSGSAASAATAPRSQHGPNAGGSPPRPGGKPSPIVRPAAGAPPPRPTGESEPHPADGEGPTVQAPPSLGDSQSQPFASAGLGGPGMRPSMNSEPPTLMPRTGGNDGRGFAGDAYANDEFDNDGDATVVGNARNPPAGPLHAPPTFPAPQTQPPAFVSTVQMSGGAPPMQVGYPQPARSGEFAFAETLGMAQPPMNPVFDPADQTRLGAPQPADAFGRPPPGPGPGMDYLGQMPGPSQRMQPTVSRMPVSYDNRTMTVDRFRRRPPMWVVAALSCSIALLIAGVVIAVVSSTGATSSAGKTVAPAGSVAGSSGGPFAATKAAFTTVVGQPPAAAVSPAVPSGAVSPTTTTAAPPQSAPSPSPGAGATPPTPRPTAAENAAAATAAPPSPAVRPVAPPPTAAATPTSSPAATARPITTTPTTAAAAQPVPTATTARKPAAGGMGAITIVCMPKCDQITDNGTALGPGHIFNRPVSSGRHVLGLSAPNGVRKNMVVEVPPGETKEVRISMDK